jgi:hypothetical protein
MSLPTTGWGAEGWGSDPWGGTTPGSPIVFQGAVAIAENVVRLYFSETPYFSGLLDQLDASLLSHYAIAPNVATQGVDGSAARPVTVLYAQVGTDPNSIDLVLDRPMTPAPSLYTVTVTGVADTATMTPLLAPVPQGFVGCYRRIVPPQLGSPLPSRDFANPQTPASLSGTSPLSPSAIAYGTYVVDDTGDYAFDEGVAAYKKRILRRGMTRKNGFAHLPGYGVGIPERGKKLASATLRQQMAADWEDQIKQEPETAAVSVSTSTDPNNPSLCYFVVLARMKTGTAVNFKTTHPTS